MTSIIFGDILPIMFALNLVTNILHCLSSALHVGSESGAQAAPSYTEKTSIGEKKVSFARRYNVFLTPTDSLEE